MLRGATVILLIFGVLGSLAAANLSGSLFGLSPRQLLFPAAMVLGLTLLVLVGNKRPRRGPENVEITPEPRDEPKQPTTTLGRLLSDDRVLAPDDARQWLDDFLLEQQK
jgi:hypothetical protein